MDNKSKTELLVNNTLWMYISKIIVQLFGFIVSVLIIRKLSVTEYGTYTFLLSLFFIVQILIINPIGSVLNRYIPELINNKHYNKLLITIVIIIH